MFGLKDKHIKVIQSVFCNYSSVDIAVLYGSRAKGDDLNLSTLLE